MSKISVISIFLDYFRTLKNAKNGKTSLIDILIQFCVPILIGIIHAIFSFKINLSTISSVVATISALMCAVAIMIYQTRMQVFNNDSCFESRQRKLVDELFSDIVWSICVGFFIVILIIFLNQFNWIKSLIACLLTHFFLVGLMCLKRINSAYSFLKMP